FSAVGLLIFWRRSVDPLGLLVSIGLIMNGVCLTRSDEAVAATPPPWQWLGVFLMVAGNSLGVAGLATLPDGRFVPRWARRVTIFWIGCLIVRYVFLSQYARPDGRFVAGANDPGPLFSLAVLLLAIGGYLSSGAAQVQRYLRFASPT